MDEKREKRLEQVAIAVIALFSIFIFTYGNSWGLPNQIRYSDHLTGGVMKLLGTKSLYIGSFHRSQPVYFIYGVPQGLYLGYEYIKGNLPVEQIRSIYDVPPRILYNTVLIGNFLSAILTLIAVLLVYAAARQFLGLWPSLLAALLFASNTIVLTYAHFATDLTPALLGSALCIYFLAKFSTAFSSSKPENHELESHAEQKYFYLLCISVGFAAAMKYLFGFLVVIPLLIIVFKFFTKLFTEGNEENNERIFTAAKFVTFANSNSFLFKGLLLIPLVFVLLNPALPFHFSDFLSTGLFHSSLSSNSIEGLTVPYPVYKWHAYSIFHSFWILPTIFLAASLILYTILKPKPLWLSINLLTVIFFLLFFGSWHYMIPRMLLVVMPFMVLLIAWTASALPRALSAYLPAYLHDKFSALSGIMLVILAISAIAYSSTAVLGFGNDSRDSANAFIRSSSQNNPAIPAGSKILISTAVNELSPYINMQSYNLISIEYVVNQSRNSNANINANINVDINADIDSAVSNSGACYAVLSSFWYSNYIDSDDDPFTGSFTVVAKFNDSKMTEFYSRMLDGSLGFEKIAGFKYKPLFSQKLELVNPTILILKNKNC